MKWIREAADAVVLGLACTIAPADVHAAQELTDLQTVLAEDFSDGIGAWRKQRLDRRLTEYRIIDIDGNSVLKAASHNAAAALLMPVDRHSISQGRLRWRWRVMTSLTENLRETERTETTMPLACSSCSGMPSSARARGRLPTPGPAMCRLEADT